MSGKDKDHKGHKDRNLHNLNKLNKPSFSACICLNLFLSLSLLTEICRGAETCFTQTLLKGKDQSLSLLKGDTVSVNLEKVSQGAGPQYSLKKKEGGVETQDQGYIGEIKTPFDISFAQGEWLTKGCFDYTKGLQDNDFLVLCQNNTVIAFSTDRRSGKPLNPKVKANIVPSKTALCSSIQSSKSDAYLTCLDANNTISVVAINLDTLEARPGPVLKIEQKKGQVLSQNLKTVVGKTRTNARGKTTTNIFIYEVLSSTNAEIRFRLVSDINNVLTDLKYFSTKTKNLVNLKDNTVYSLFLRSNVLYISTFDSKTFKNYIQKCPENPTGDATLKVFTCTDKVLETTEGKGLFQIQKRAGSPATIRTVFSNTTNPSTIDLSFGVLNEEEFTWQGTSSYNLKDSFLAKTSRLFLIGENTYLIGSTDASSPLTMDGLVKYSADLGSHYSYKLESAGQLAFMRRSYYDTQDADYFNWQEKKLSFIKVSHFRYEIDSTQMKGGNDLSVEIGCKTQGYAPSSAPLSLSSLSSPDTPPSFSIPSLTGILGSPSLTAPINRGTVKGNAVEIKVDGLKTEGLVISVEMFKKLGVKQLDDEFKNITDIRYVGENNFLMVSYNKSVLFTCMQEPLTAVVYCKNSYTIDHLKDKSKILAASLQKNKLVYVLSLPTDTDAKLHTEVRGYDLETKKESIDTSYDINLEHASVQIKDNWCTILVLGKKTHSSNRGIYFVKISMDWKEPFEKKEFALAASTPVHMCPTEISWEPRNLENFFVASICKNTQEKLPLSHVYRYRFAQDTAELIEIYDMNQRENFAICAENGFFNMIDYKNGEVKTLSAGKQETTFEELSFPLQFYAEKLGKGTTLNITAHTCDQSNHLVQVLACKAKDPNSKDDDPSECLLVSYKSDQKDRLNRVHSVTKVPSFVKTLASNFNNENDNTITLAVGDTNEQFFAYQLDMDGPHINFNSLNVKQEGNIDINWNVTFANGKANNLKQVTSKLNLVKQNTDLSITPVKEDQKLPTNGEFFDFENYFKLTGPYHNLGKQNNDVFQFVDRFSASNQFSAVKKQFDNAIFHENYIAAREVSSEGVDFVVYKLDKEIHRVKNRDIQHLYVVTKGDKEIYFFGYISKLSTNDEIVCIFTMDNQKTWDHVKVTLPGQSYQKMILRDGPLDTFVFGGTNNNDDFGINLFAFRITDANIEKGMTQTISFSRNVVDFSFISFPVDKNSGNIVVFAATEYSQKGHIYYYTVQGEDLSFRANIQTELVPNENEAHLGMLFDCEQTGKDLSKVQCVHTGLNKHSYLVEHTFDWYSKTPDTFWKSSTVLSKFRNIVNMKPVHLDLKNNFFAVLSLNQYPFRQNDTSPDISFFSESMVTLVYKIDTLVPQIEGLGQDTVPTRDVYKILRKEDYGMDDEDLDSLKPRFFVNENGATKLGVNLKSQKRSVKVFNNEGLKMSISEEKLKATQKPENLEISLGGLSTQPIELNIGKFIDVKKQEGGGGDPEDEGFKFKWWYFLIIGLFCLILIIIIIVFIVYKRGKDSETSEDAQLYDVEKTMKPDDSQASGMQSGNYSKL